MEIDKADELVTWQIGPGWGWVFAQYWPVFKDPPEWLCKLSFKGRCKVGKCKIGFHLGNRGWENASELLENVHFAASLLAPSGR